MNFIKPYKKIVITAIVACFVGICYADELPKFATRLTVEDGISQSTVYGSIQDDSGRIWFATADGISIWNGQEFLYIFKDYENVNGLQANYTRDIKLGPLGRVWIATLGGGISVYSQDAKPIATYTKENSSLASNDVYTMEFGLDGTFWVGTQSGLQFANDVDYEMSQIEEFTSFGNTSEIGSVFALEVLSDNSVFVGFKGSGLHKYSMSGDVVSTYLHTNTIMDILLDTSENIWIATEDSGLFKFNSSREEPYRFYAVDDLDIEALAEDEMGRIWVGTWTKGAYIVDQKTGEIENIVSTPNQRRTLGSNTIISIDFDNFGNAWLGSFDKGLSKINITDDVFQVLYSVPGSDESLPSPTVWAIEEGLDREIWIGTKGGLTRLNKYGEVRTAKLPNSILDVRNLLHTPTGLLIAAKGSGLHFLNYRSGLVEPVQNKRGENVLAKVFTRLIRKDPKAGYWVGTHSGLFKLAENFDVEFHLEASDHKGSLPHNRIRSIEFTKDGTVWIGTSGGLSKFIAATNSFETYSGPSFLPDNDVRGVFELGATKLLVATGGGLSILDVQEKTADFLTRQDGLPNETLYGLIPDDNGFLWIPTNDGLVKFNLADHEIEIFTSADGLANEEFNFDAFELLNDGRIALGGINGVTFFDPALVNRDESEPIVSAQFLGALLSDEQKIDLGTAPVKLKFDSQVIHYANPPKNSFQWKLEPLDNTWNSSKGTSHSQVIENLLPGEYKLRVRGVSSQGIESSETTYEFSVNAPLYLTWPAIIFYIFSLFALGFLIQAEKTRRTRILNRKLQRSVDEKTVELAKSEAKIATELQNKSKLYARLAHEIRTPIALISGPMKSLLNGSLNPASKKIYLNLVERSMGRVVYIADEMSEASINEGTEVSKFDKCDIYGFTKPIIDYFRKLSEMSGFDFSCELVADRSVEINLLAFDTVLQNLLSNAFKYCEHGGSIQVRLELKETELCLSVENTGTFNFSTNHTLPTPTRGLMIVQNLMEEVKGKISTKSSPVQIVATFPIKEIPNSREKELLQIRSREQTVLVLENDFDLKMYITHQFSEIVNVVSVSNVAAAKRAVQYKKIDLIVSDINLPDGNGLDFAIETKQHASTAHIPIVMLTGNSEENNKMRAKAHLVDSYFSKPFDIEELVYQVSTLLNVVKKTSHKVKSTANTGSQMGAVELSPRDELWLEQFNTYVAAHLNDPTLSIGVVASECGMSVRNLQRSLSTTLKTSFIEVVGKKRMEQAVKLLGQGLPVNEVASQCGYKSHSSFTRKYKLTFGELPKSK